MQVQSQQSIANRVLNFLLAPAHWLRPSLGVTLIEMLATVGILLVLSGAVFVSAQATKRSQAVQRAMHTTLLALRVAQTKAASSATTTKGGIPFGYGIFFSAQAELRESIILFADLDGDKAYDADTETVERRPIPPPMQIEKVEVCSPATSSPCSSWTQVPPPWPPDVTVYFCPPNPNTFLFGKQDLARGPVGSCTAPSPSDQRSAVRISFSATSGEVPAGVPHRIIINAAGAAFVQ